MSLLKITVYYLVAFLTSTRAERRLRRRASQQEASVFRLTVSDELLRLPDGSLAYLEHVMAIPVTNGVETSDYYAIDLPDYIEENYYDKIEEGALFISTTGATVENSTLVLDDQAMVTVLAESPIIALNIQQKSTRSVAILRVSLVEGATITRQVKYSASEIEEHFFEKNTSLKVQMGHCTNGAINIESAGVFEILVPSSLESFVSPASLRNSALQIFSDLMGSPSPNSVADHIVVILPENNFHGFIGNAGTNHWMSTLNNEWALDVMVRHHEIAHNLGLGHAYLANNSWDFSSYMSATGFEPNLEGPLKCYNAASNVQMGWFADRTLEIDFSQQPAHLINLVAFSEAEIGISSDPVILRIGEYAVQYNFASGFNAGTEMFRDQITIAHSEPGKTIVENEGLSPGSGMFVKENFGDTSKTLRLQACEQIAGGSGTPNSMALGISLGVEGSPCDIETITSQKTVCPDTSKNQILFRWGKGVISVDCRYLDTFDGDKNALCQTLVYGEKQTKIHHVCRRECAAQADCVRE